MNGVTTLKKLYQIREKELEEVQAQYNRAVDFFEQEATKLYNLLKNKEKTEANLNARLVSGLQVHNLNDYQRYYDSLYKEESKHQQKVHQARVNMYNKQEALQEAHTELKKLEKLIENKTEQQRLMEKQAEAAFLDEISVQQYSRTK
ncbi:flagellar export protein FliJ [Alkalibacillus aidingensis]|uniref:flagellar export protein FliJ n=1 Tax=Alkalibacillus aidingensis TaxID=2747607 RepID=UPI0016614D10|nr:flagellar export protein FliJ [Alkalibacillus aidingensis]